MIGYVWRQDYEVVVLVGAGIGVTPFASVLADLVNRLESKKCKLCGEVRSMTAGSVVCRCHVLAIPAQRVVASSTPAGTAFIQYAVWPCQFIA